MRREGPIVVIDDDLDDQYLYKKVFEKFAIENQIVLLSNGLEALQYFQQSVNEPFIILCDINMPVMDGLQLREAMCCDPTLCKKNTPFIFISTSIRKTEIDRASSLNTHGFFKKENSYNRHENTLRKIVDYWGSCIS